jgi:hypothetical protein
MENGTGGEILKSQGRKHNLLSVLRIWGGLKQILHLLSPVLFCGSLHLFITYHYLTNYRMLGLSQSSETHHASLNITSLHSHTASISQSTAITQDIVRQLQETSLDTKKVVETMNASLSDRIGLLNESFEVILRTTVNNVRDQFIAELNSEAQAIKSSSSSFGHISGIRTHQFRARNTKCCISTGSSQQLRRQVGYRRVYRVWFATIIVTSRTTTIRQSLDPCGDNRSSFRNDTSSCIIIDIRPHPWITLRGVLGFIDRHSTGTSVLNCDVRL